MYRPKIGIALFLGLLFFVFSFSFGSAQDDSSGRLAHARQAANIRSDTSTSASISGQLSEGAALRILGASEGQSVSLNGVTSTLWYEVESLCDDTRGYIWSGLLSLSESQATDDFFTHCVRTNFYEPLTCPTTQSQANEGIRAAVNYAQANDALLNGSVDLHISSDFEALYSAYVDFAEQNAIAFNNANLRQQLQDRWVCPNNTCAEANFGAVFVYVGSCGNGIRTIKLTTAHEMMHIFQFMSLGRDSVLSNSRRTPDQMRDYGPTWLLEGGADFQATRALEMDYLPAVTGIENLAAMEIPNDFYAVGHAYGMGHYAVAVLVENSSESALFDYFRRIGEGQAWQDAFESAFGLTLGEFYSLVADYPLRPTVTNAASGSGEPVDLNTESVFMNPANEDLGQASVQILVPLSTRLVFYTEPRLNDVTVAGFCNAPPAQLSATRQAGDFYLVSCPYEGGEFSGWLHQDMVRPPLSNTENQSEIEMEPLTGTGTLTRPFVQLFVSPQSNQSITACSGEVVLNGRAEEWLNITCASGESGWVLADTVAIDSD